jgi:ABC-2 type transport system ATP-binding protein
VARLANAVPLRDLSVREPEIEDVVARLYLASRASSTAT